MRLAKLLALSALGALTVLPVAGKSISQASVIEARLLSVEDISGKPDASCICDEKGTILFDGSFRLFFKPVRTVAGPLVSAELRYDQASARPNIGGHYLLVVLQEGMSDRIFWKGRAETGLCLSEDDIKTYRLQRIARKMPCLN
jgi:hypothetical protein